MIGEDVVQVKVHAFDAAVVVITALSKEVESSDRGISVARGETTEKEEKEDLPFILLFFSSH